MIKKYWGKNFGKIGNFSVSLKPLTLLVGPNASGKSTFLRGLRLLALLNRMPLYGTTGPLRLGFRSTLEELFPDDGSSRELCLGVECSNPRGSGMYEITLGYVRGRLKVTKELAKWTPSGGSAFSFDSESEPIEIDYRGSTLQWPPPSRQ